MTNLKSFWLTLYLADFFFKLVGATRSIFHYSLLDRVCLLSLFSTSEFPYEYPYQIFTSLLIKYLSPIVGSMIKYWVTTFWFIACLWWFMFHMNQKVVTQNFIIEPTSDKYFSSLVKVGNVIGKFSY